MKDVNKALPFIFFLLQFLFRWFFFNLRVALVFTASKPFLKFQIYLFLNYLQWSKAPQNQIFYCGLLNRRKSWKYIYYLFLCVCVCFFKTHLLQQSLLSKTVKMLQRFKLPGKGFFKFFLAYLRVMGPPQTLSTILQR